MPALSLAILFYYPTIKAHYVFKLHPFSHVTFSSYIYLSRPSQKAEGGSTLYGSLGVGLVSHA